MPTFRRPKDHRHPYAQINNEVLETDALSFKAKGILSYLLSRCDEWEVYQSQLANVGPDGRTAVRSGIEELIEAGYIVRQRVRADDGTFSGWEYLVFEYPQDTDGTDITKPDFGSRENGDSENGEAHTTNTNSNQDGKEPTRKGAHAPAGDDETTDASPDPITIHQEHFGAVSLSIGQKEQIRAKVDDVDTWREVVEYWMLNDYRGRSVGKMIQMYREKKTEEKSGSAALTEEQKRNPDWTINDDGERCFKGVPVSQLGPNATPTDA